jgi:hypothetical protein
VARAVVTWHALSPRGSIPAKEEGVPAPPAQSVRWKHTHTRKQNWNWNWKKLLLSSHFCLQVLFFLEAFRSSDLSNLSDPFSVADLLDPPLRLLMCSIPASSADLLDPPLRLLICSIPASSADRLDSRFVC